MSMLLEAMTSDLRRLATSGAHNAQEAAPVISRTFRQLGELVENSQAENTWGRKLLCSSLQVCFYFLFFFCVWPLSVFLCFTCVV